ncbi:Uncharacterised protein [Mycobacteroides abscessus subsp. abscessus]|nr:Uncharacterised protein [Mycobacteroides abscessus subsp. abscessus]SIN59069.1 Uncharacterised protein [Mycobacteroides abscessus subsp. abscessus]
MLGMLDQVVEQRARITGQILRSERDRVRHALDGMRDDGVEQCLLVGVVDVEQPLVGFRGRADPIDTCTGQPMLRELRERRVE